MSTRLPFLTRDLAYAVAKDRVRLRGQRPHEAVPWTVETYNQYCAEVRALWTLDDEFTQQAFEVTYGREPNPVSADDYRLIRSIWAERQKAGRVYGPIPD